jgi:FdhE protein
MTKAGLPGRGTLSIGEVASPAFVHLPDPPALFAARAARFRQLSKSSDLKPYLLFLGDLSEAQQAILPELPAPRLPSEAQRQRAREHAMPPLDRAAFTVDAVFSQTRERLLQQAAAIDMPQAAAEALEYLRKAGPVELDAMAHAVLLHAIPMERLAEHSLLTAALQVHFARLAAALDAKALVAVGDALCPVCGGPPAASMVVGWQGAHGTRYCGCGLCGTLWNYVRIKCTLCASTKGISYQELEGGPGTVKAECCSECQGYVKVLQQQKDPQVDVLADDVASLGLDLLMREAGFRRGALNPFLIGY